MNSRTPIMFLKLSKAVINTSTISYINKHDDEYIIYTNRPQWGMNWGAAFVAYQTVTINKKISPTDYAIIDKWINEYIPDIE